MFVFVFQTGFVGLGTQLRAERLPGVHEALGPTSAPSKQQKRVFVMFLLERTRDAVLLLLGCHEGQQPCCFLPAIVRRSLCLPP